MLQLNYETQGAPVLTNTNIVIFEFIIIVILNGKDFKPVLKKRRRRIWGLSCSQMVSMAVG